MARTIALTTLVCFTFMCGTLMAQKPLPFDALDNNAALSYWQAFALLPPIDDKTRERMRSIMRGDSSVDDNMRKLVAASEDSLLLLYRGASIESCGWGIAYDNGPYTLLPHLGKARELSRIALLRARIRFDAGQLEEGMNDSIAAIQLGRHAGHDGVVVLINILVGFAIEFEAIETIVASLHRLNLEQRNEFEQRINQVQPAVDMKAAVQGERDVFLGWLIREIESGRSGDRILELASELGSGTEPRIIARVKQASPEQLLNWAKKMNAFYDTVLAAMSPDSDEANAKVEDLDAQLSHPQTGNPLGELFLPALGPARQAAKRLVTKRAQLKAAFALFDGGPSVLDRAALGDPFGDGPFQLKRLNDGAELISDLKRGDTPLKLQIPGLPK
jgi:hypothetical protein